MLGPYQKGRGFESRAGMARALMQSPQGPSQFDGMARMLMRGALADQTGNAVPQGAVSPGSAAVMVDAPGAPPPMPYEAPIAQFQPETGTPSPAAGITPELLDALRQVESSGGKRLVSEAGALGPYQLMPGTAKAYGVDPMNEEQSRWAAQEILKDGLERFGGLDQALMAYHAGNGNMSKYLAGERSGVGPRTLAYPGKVMSAMRLA